MNTSSSNKINNLSKLSKNELTKRDVFGRTILHVTILTNRHDLLRNLLKNRDIKDIIAYGDYESGWNCLHYVIFHKRLACFKVLIDFLKASNTYSELLKAKDRNGQTPMQLLNNDFKDLLWIPEYINEKNECHLVYRFQDLAAEKKPEPLVEETGNQTNTTETSPPSTAFTTPPTSSQPPIRSTDKSWTKRSGSEIYVLGANNHQQLGVGDHKDRNIPTKLQHESFKTDCQNASSQIRFNKPRYRKVMLSKNHSVILSHDGKLFSCGMGSRGRLGLGNLGNCLSFRLINHFPENDLFVRDFSISNNHSIALTRDNEIYGWGLNSYNQLGVRTATSAKDYLDIFEIHPTIILGDLKKNNRHIRGISTSNVHSVAFTKSELFSWGLNIGQMGIPSLNPDLELNQDGNVFRGEVVNQPRSISLRDEIKLITACDTCTILVTVKDEIHVYFQFQHVKLPKIPIKGDSVDQFSLFKPNRLTKPIEITKIAMKSIRCCAILLKAGDVFTFKLDTKDVKNVKYTQVWKAYDHGMNVTDIDISEDGSIVLCTRNGSVFVKSDQASGAKKSITDVTQQSLNIKNKFKKIDQLNKVLEVSCDPKFFSFGFVRDDIDLLPLKLQKNDFIEDINYLSPLVDINLTRKQEQLLQIDHSTNTYISRFIYPNSLEVNDDEDEDEVENDKDANVKDILFDSYNSRYDPSVSKRVNTSSTFEDVLDLEFAPLLELFRIGPEVVGRLCLESAPHKDFDCFITVEKYPDIRIGIHRSIFEARSIIFKRIFCAQTDEFFVQDKIYAKYNPCTMELEIRGDVNLSALLLFVHFVFTNTTMHQSLSKFLPDIRDIREQYGNLLRIFGVEPILNSNKYLAQLTKGLQNALENVSSGDVIVKLGDGEIRCHSYILKSRSAFFETLLSSRWDSSLDRVLDFSGLSTFQFKFIMQHLYGQNNYDIFDYFDFAFEDTDEFVNIMLEMIELSDELLLFQLKALCQMAISDFICLENVTLLLVHADYLSAPKLFMNCCWYIYNNLEVLLFDSSWNDLSVEVTRKLEKQINFFQNCQTKDFSNTKGVLNEKVVNFYFERDSNLLVSKFVNDVGGFNEFFIDDRKGFQAFEPLVDIKLRDQVKLSNPKSRRGSSKANMVDEVTVFRNSVKTRSKEVSQPLSEDDRGFEVVTKGTRRKSSAVAMNKSPTPEIVPTKEESTTSNSGRRSVSLPWSNPIVDVKSEPKTTTLSYLNGGNNSALELSTATNSRSSTPIESSKSTGIVNINKKSQKLRIGPMLKLSQKERKRLNNQANDENTDPKAGNRTGNPNPWGSSVQPAPMNGRLDSAGAQLSSNYTHVMPVLGSSKGNSKPKRKPSALNYINELVAVPSPIFGNIKNDSSESINYSEFMADEYSQLEQALSQKKVERKTLADIQKEEEFAKWWAEESLKVQKQLDTLTAPKLKKANPKKTKLKNKPKKQRSPSMNTESTYSKRKISVDSIDSAN